MGQENVREDFLLGRNGAASLTENDLKLLDDLYPEVSPKHEMGNPEAFTNQVQSAAEHLLAVVDGKPKEAVGSTYTYIKEVIGKIHESGYFDQAMLEAAPVYYDETSGSVPVTTGAVEPLVEEAAKSVAEAPPALYQPEASLPPPQQQQVPETQTFYQQPQQQPPPQQQQQRPISEVLGTGSFFFLQDSELDTPPEQPQMLAAVVAPSTIPTQTFTNQNYVGVAQQQMAAPGFAQQNPPPPIPMPPSCLSQGAQLEYNNAQGQMLFQQYQPEMNKQQQQPPQQTEGLRNGGGALDDNPTLDGTRQTNDDDAGGGSPRGGPRQKYNNNPPQRRNGGQQQQQGATGGGGGGYQPFYQNNNGYGNNRSRNHPQGGGGRGGQRSNNGGGRPVHHSNKPPRQPQQ